MVDLGCGYGPIACTVAARHPALEVVAVDVNSRARELCAAERRGARASTSRCWRPTRCRTGLAVGGDRVQSTDPDRQAALHALLDRVAAADWPRRAGVPGRAQEPGCRLAAALAAPSRVARSDGWLTPGLPGARSMRRVRAQRRRAVRPSGGLITGGRQRIRAGSTCNGKRPGGRSELGKVVQQRLPVVAAQDVATVHRARRRAHAGRVSPRRSTYSSAALRRRPRRSSLPAGTAASAAGQPRPGSPVAGSARSAAWTTSCSGMRVWTTSRPPRVAASEEAIGAAPPAPGPPRPHGTGGPAAPGRSPGTPPGPRRRAGAAPPRSRSRSGPPVEPAAPPGGPATASLSRSLRATGSRTSASSSSRARVTPTRSVAIAVEPHSDRPPGRTAPHLAADQVGRSSWWTAAPHRSHSAKVPQLRQARSRARPVRFRTHTTRPPSAPPRRRRRAGSSRDPYGRCPRPCGRSRRRRPAAAAHARRQPFARSGGSTSAPSSAVPPPRRRARDCAATGCLCSECLERGARRHEHARNPRPPGAFDRHLTCVPGR